MALQRTGRGEAEDVVDAIRLAPVEDLRTGVVAVGAQQDVHLRPVGADRADQAPEKGADLDALRPLRRAQDGGDEAALAIEDDDRLEAVVVIMGVEQAQLLAAVHRVEGVVDIEDDALRHLRRPEPGPGAAASAHPAGSPAARWSTANTGPDPTATVRAPSYTPDRGAGGW